MYFSIPVNVVYAHFEHFEKNVTLELPKEIFKNVEFLR